MELKQIYTRRSISGQNYAQPIIFEWEDVIAKELNVNPSYVTKVIQKDDRYIPEKEYRAKISKENRKKSKCEWIRNKRE